MPRIANGSAFEVSGWSACQARDISIPKTNAADVLELLASGERLNLASESSSIRSLQTTLEGHQALKFLSERVLMSGKLRINVAEGIVDAKAEDFVVYLAQCASVRVTQVEALVSQARSASVAETRQSVPVLLPDEWRDASEQ